MSARRRRAAVSAVAALVAALGFAVLAGVVDGYVHGDVFVVLAIAWLAVAGAYTAGVLRTEPSVVPARAEPDEST
jgi:hypothetical protein